MDLLNSNCAEKVEKASRIPFVGFVTGPVVIIMGVVQFALNTVAFSSLIFAFYAKKPKAG